MAGEVHPVPFRTRKLSPPAPMVLRSKSVGEQDVADQRGAFSCAEGGRPHAGRPPSPCVGHGMRPRLAYAPSPPRDALPVMSGSRSPTKFDRVWSAGAVFLHSVPRGRPVPPSAWGGPGRPLFALGGARRPRADRPPRVVCKPWRRPAPLAGGGAGAYINSSRDGAAADAGGPSAGRTLRTGYRDRRGRASYRQHYYLGWLASARQAPRRFLSLNGR